MRHVQIILRRYATISQVLLYFDIDACQLAYDGSTVLATPAARRALTSGVNVADATCRSSSYEQRLHKYARRGFGVVVPGLDPSRIDARRFSQGLFTRTGGGLRPVHVTLPEVRLRASARARARLRARLRATATVAARVRPNPDPDPNQGRQEGRGRPVPQAVPWRGAA